jgi:hypothetical protein
MPFKEYIPLVIQEINVSGLVYVPSSHAASKKQDKP